MISFCSKRTSIDYPLATLQAARDKIRELKKTGLYPKGYTVYLRGGTYNVLKGFVLEKEDSGTAEAPITYCAYPGEKVCFTGGVKTTGKELTKVTDKELLDRVVEEAARDKIYMLDLKKYGVTDLGEPYWIGSYSYSSAFVNAGLVKKPVAPAPEILFNGKPLTQARYPNEGNIMTESVVEEGWNMNTNKDRYPVGTPFTITVTDKRIAKWTKAPEGSILMFGYWRRDYSDQTVPLQKIDVSKMTLTSGISTVIGVDANRPFYVYNLIEEIDIPGEYFIDRDTNIIYMYPPSGYETAELTLTLMEEPIFTLNETEYVNFKGIDVYGSRSNAYKINKGKYNEISEADISFTATRAIRITGYNNSVRNCYIHDVDGGVILEGGEASTLTLGNNVVENCEIERFARLTPLYVAAVGAYGVGDIIRYNEIHDSTHFAIEYSYHYNKIMYNEIYDVLKSTDDAGAIYGGLSWVDGRGTEIKYNYIHDLAVKDAISAAVSGLAGVYVDGGQCGVIIAGNVFENIDGRGTWINGGRHNIVTNNVYVNCKQGQLFSDIMVSYLDALDRYHNEVENKKDYLYSEKYKQAFPEMYGMLELPDSEKVLPYDNKFFNNVSYNTPLINARTGRATTTDYLDYSQNFETKQDPGFYDVENRDYTIKEDSEIFAKLPGFKAVPFTRMGRVNERAEARIRDAKILVIDSPTAFVNGEEQRIDPDNEAVVPFIKDNITYVPLRFMAEVLDAEVNYDGENNLVQISSPTVSLTIPIGGSDAKKNGESITLSNPTILVNSRTMVPLREISELFDKQVFWHNSGFISVSDDSTLFDENGSDDEIIRYLHSRLNKY